MCEPCSGPSETTNTTREPNALPTTPGVCPVNGQPGMPVPGQTVKALLAVSLRTLGDTEYRFCADEQCAVVYFSTDGSHLFTSADLRERVYQKERSTSTVWVCYCFRHTVGDVQTADHTTQQAIITDIVQGIQAGQCACDLRNPQGSCCLGNVRTLVKAHPAA